MRNSFLSKFTAVFLAAILITLFGVVGANAAVIDDGFESVTADEDSTISTFSESSLPSRYSSKDEGFVTEVKSQKYQDCWAYAGLAAFESKLLKSGINIESMSTDHLNVWATKRSNGKGWQRDIFGNGYTYISTGYLTSWQGGVEQSALNGIDFTQDFFGDDMPADLTKYGTTAIKYLTGNNKSEIKQSIIDNGGVFTSYATTSDCYSLNNAAYYMPQSYTGSYTGHSIEVVGWNDNYSKNNFNGSINQKPQNNGAWLVKNSWGNYNALGGYFWISYEDKYIFGSKYNPSFTIEQVTALDGKTQLLQNEIYGATYSFGYIESDEITYINRFDFDDNFRTIDKVMFETKTAGADYCIYYIPIKDNAPTADTSEWTLIDSGIVDYNGYLCCDVEDFTVFDKEGAIGITINTAELNNGLGTNDNGYVNNNIGVGEWLIKDGIYSFLNESQRGKSYVYNDGKMEDLMDWYKETADDDMGGTFVIKAVTKESPKPTLLGDANLDGFVNVKDITLIQKSIAKIETLNEDSKLNADYTGDGTIDINDVTAIQKHIVGII